jgi:putative membrane protein
MKKLILTGCIAGAFLVSCQQKKDSVEQAENTNEQNMKDSILTLDKDDERFMVKAANGGLMEVAAGKLAHEKGSSKEVKEFGHHMMEDHEKANNELKQLAEAKKVMLPDSLDSDSKDKLDKLSKKSGKDFDKAYMDAMVSDHKKDVNDFEDATKNAKDTEVKAFAEKTLPTLKMHLDMAQKTDSIVKKTSGKKMMGSVKK